MLLGQFEGRIDEKSRISFPKRFREVVGEKLVLTKGLEKNVIIVSEKNWEALLEGTQDKPFINRDARELQRFILGNAMFVELDEKGRFLLPDFLRKYAAISGTVIFAGMKRFIELWDKENWEEEQERLSKSIPSITARLTERGEDE